MPLSLAQVPYPATTAVLEDSGGVAGSYLATYNQTSIPWWGGLSKDGQFDRIHSGGANILFVDGHVKWRKPEAFISTSNDYTGFPVEQTRCWYAYQRNDGVHPWFKP